MLKKIVIIVVLLCISFFTLSLNAEVIVFADTFSLDETIIEELNEFDFSFFDDVLSSFNENEQQILSFSSFYECVKSIIFGDYTFNFESLLRLIFEIFNKNLLEIIPTLCLIIIMVVLLNLLANISYEKNSESTKNIIHFLCYGIIIIIISHLITNSVVYIKSFMESISGQMEITFPILLTLITTIGDTNNIALFQPAIAILINGIMKLFSNVLIPLFLISFVFTIADNLVKDTRLKNFVELSQSIFKWLIGIIFTLFLAYMSLNTIIATSYNGISIKTAKYTLKSSIPYIGNYMSDGLDILICSSILIKNAVGVCGLILLIISVANPLLNLIVISLGLKLTGAILEPISDKRISNFVYSIGNVLKMLIACIVSVSILYFISVCMLLSIGNLF